MSHDPWLNDLTRIERLHFRIARRMNSEPIKTVTSYVARFVNANVIGAIAGRQARLHGIAHVERAWRDKAILLVSNHRSYFDMFVVASMLFKRRRIKVLFPVRSRYYYETVGGLLLNGVAAHFGMYPPLFLGGDRQWLNPFCIDIIAKICANGGSGWVVGIHPEGTRSKNPDPYSLGPYGSGAGRIIHAARPNVLPVFIGGLSNSVREIVANNFRQAPPIRIHFGAAMDLSAFLDMEATSLTFRAITDQVMARVRELGEQDRALYAGQTA
jgi:1-acyl-sn-glycerol-3-phosphate acyltransferase